jgi:hypothetical protein
MADSTWKDFVFQHSINDSRLSIACSTKKHNLLKKNKGFQSACANINFSLIMVDGWAGFNGFILSYDLV